VWYRERQQGRADGENGKVISNLSRKVQGTGFYLPPRAFCHSIPMQQALKGSSIYG